MEEMHLLGSSLLSPQNKNNFDGQWHALPRSGIVHDLNVIPLYRAVSILIKLAQLVVKMVNL